MFIKAGSLFSSLTRRSKISGAVNAIIVRQTFLEVLYKECEDLGVEVLSGVKPVSFKFNTLTVKCPRLVGVELSMRSEGLIKAVNEEIGKTVIKKIKFN